MLADYPSSDGWQLFGADVFSSDKLAKQLQKSQIVLCNPPFENFSKRESAEYGRLVKRKQKPAEIFERVLNSAPAIVGFVMPRVFLHGNAYMDLREKVGRIYGEVELVALPGGVFLHSDAESVLVMAYNQNPTENSVHVVGRWVGEGDKDEFLRKGEARIETSYEISRSGSSDAMMIWRDPLSEIWNSLYANPKLGDIAELHRGIEWNIAVSLEENRRSLISASPKRDFELGLDTARGKLAPYKIKSTVYLNTAPSLARGNAYKYPWKDEKVILNAATASRGPWRLIAAPDHEGLVCYQRLHGVWLKTMMPINVLAHQSQVKQKRRLSRAKIGRHLSSWACV